MKKSLIALTVTLLGAIVLSSCSSHEGGPTQVQTEISPDAKLAKTIRSDPQLSSVRSKAVQLIAKGSAAGTSYPYVFIRDLNTFVELAIEAQGAASVRAQLKRFLEYQSDDGNIADAIAVSGNSTLKATVEVDQESSLLQAVAKYVAITGDTAFLLESVSNLPIIVRLENALNYLYAQRYASKYGLLFGGTRADWGDVQPEDSPGITLNDLSHPSICIYDNAMLTLALKSIQQLEKAVGHDASLWAGRERDLVGAIRTYLWNGVKFIPHIYLEKGSSMPAGFDESVIYFQGGTAVALQAGLLTPSEVKQTFAQMIRNKIDSKSGSIGVSLYPTYPADFFKNREYMGGAYVYQNGGDWPWFGARIIQQMIVAGEIDLAYTELKPMLDRVVRDNGFYEWYTPEGLKQGSGDYRGTAGQLVKAIDMMLDWASRH